MKLELGKIANPKLANEGEKNFNWARNHMVALTSLAERYAKSKPLEGTTVGEIGRAHV